MEQVVMAMSCNPARILKLEGGVIEKGKPADITIVDENKKWTVDTEKFESKGKNCIFEDLELTGKAAYTIVDGKVVLDNYRLK